MTQNYSRRSVLQLAGAGSVASLAGCAGSGSNGNSSSAVRISGGVGPLPMVEVWADMYEDQTGVTFDISGGGTGVGVSDLFNGQVDVAMMGRDPDEEELEEGLIAVPMLIDTVVGTVNVDNPVYDELRENGLTREDLEAIFTREITNWGDVADADVDEEITVYGRSDSSAAYQQWGDFLGGDGDKHTESELENLADANHNGDQSVAEAIGRNENAVSLNNINYVYDLGSGELESDVRPIPLDIDGDGLSEDEDFYETRDEFLEAVEAGIYPAPPAREMFLAADDGFEDEAYDFVEWVLTDGQEYVSENGYVPLEEDRLEEALEKLAEGP
ncbi:PstS family phosphate ABC transporter substrate-binding protein [Natrarchaeobaculum sulfurireducens]|uniref:ABC-type phosphate transport system, periplasmic component n=1 Tax=Natrarchaeobaculum sulfurireducens TaxID=2044521 RepID=A0A346PFW8_9EURY|nr:substrate-binding domain-containing protein [Natrarchaeobaculum sulfurireducens]AXR78413.1 ABC-type phosphate transport system, periplasmic component [Natrarchaeobaculum sulfurireducens]